MILVARTAWYGGIWRRQLRLAGSGDAGPRRADAFADLSDARANTDANTDSNAGYDAGALRERGHGTRARAATNSAGTVDGRTARAAPAPARVALARRGRRRGHRVRASAGGVAGRAARAALRKRHCLRPRRALHCG